MEARGYGTWSADDLVSNLSTLTPDNDTTDYDVIGFTETLKEHGHYESFVKAFREFLLDDSLTLQEKGRLYFDGLGPSGMTWDYCKWLWGLIAPGQEWPLEGRPRPEDEPPPKSYQFKPE